MNTAAARTERRRQVRAAQARKTAAHTSAIARNTVRVLREQGRTVSVPTVRTWMGR
jgi:hypothetical protein